MYVCEGFCVVDVAPLPKSHAHEVGEPVEVSVKFTVRGTVPDVGAAVKEATGAAGPPGGLTVMVLVLDVEPAALVAVSLAVYVPAVE